MNLSVTDKHHLRAAQGWLELGHQGEANMELGNISEEAQEHPAVLEVSWEVYARVKLWPLCVDNGRKLVKCAPERARSWIKLAFALHAQARTDEAWDCLRPAAEKFPEDATIRYNLACYACRLGRIEEAREWLSQAFRLGDARKLKALDDPDLKPLWKGEPR